jgi:hypothetical protein
MAVRSTFFRVDGADQDTGEDTYLVLQAGSKPEAETIARRQGILISSIRIAKPQDWSAAPAEPSPEPDPEPVKDHESQVEPDREPMVAVTLTSEPAPPVEPQAVAPAPAPPLIVRKSRIRVPVPVLILTGIGGLLEVAGLVTLLVGLIPDHALRNELQQLDVRLRLLNLIIVSSTLILSGLIVLLIAAVWFFADTRLTLGAQPSAERSA